MEDIKYPIELEVVTPLSVGAGNEKEWIRGIDYIQKEDGKIYVLDIQKAVANGVDIDRLTNLFLKSDEKGISKLLGNNLEKMSRYIFDSPVSTINSIKTFLRTQLFDKPVVAGSSLKGAIRSALFNHLRDNEETNAEVFGDMQKGTDLMRFVHVASWLILKSITCGKRVIPGMEVGNTVAPEMVILILMVITSQQDLIRYMSVLFQERKALVLLHWQEGHSN